MSLHTIEPSFDSSHFLSSSVDKTIKLFERKTGKQITAYEHHSDQVSQIRFNSNGNRIVSVGADGNIHIYKYE